MWRMRLRTFAGVFLQAPAFLSVLSSETARPGATRSIVADVEYNMLGSLCGINPACDRSGPGVVEFGEWLCEKVLKYVPHRQWVFSIPKQLRIYFMFDRKLLFDDQPLSPAG